MHRQAFRQEPLELCFCDSGVATKVEFLHNSPVVTEPLESGIAPAEGEQVGSCVGEVGEDVHLASRKMSCCSI